MSILSVFEKFSGYIYLMNSKDDFDTLKTGNVNGLAISLTFSITSQLEIFAPAFFRAGNWTDTLILKAKV